MMLARRGKTRADIPPTTKLGRLMRNGGVQKTPELTRIEKLPRRDAHLNDDELIALVTETYKLPSGTMTARLIQARSLSDLHDYRGLFAPQRVGAGKTLTTYLAPTVIEAARPVLLFPAKLRKKTIEEFAELRRHWQAPKNLTMYSYEQLGNEDGFELLLKTNPDFIIADECQKLKNLKAACTKRVKRWMDQHPETAFLAASGTMTSRSLKDYAHLAQWCLPKHAPVPLTYNTLTEWSQALDRKLADESTRLAPGALSVFFDVDEKKLALLGKETEAARQAYRRRLTETPGVVATQDGPLADVGLSLQAVELELKNPELLRVAEMVQDDFELPTGETILGPSDLWRHMRELSLGFYQRWDPPPPTEWSIPRSMWGVALRHVLSHNGRGLDSELPVKNAVRRGEYDHAYVIDNGRKVFEQTVRELYDAWAEIEPIFEPNPVPVWIDDTVLRFVAERMAKDPGELVWVEHVAFGEALAKLTGAPYYRELATDRKTRRSIMHHDVKKHGPAIASIASCGEGLNLQKWNRGFLTSVPPNGALCEQLLGRKHRDGQEADEVVYSWLITSHWQLQGVYNAIEDARYIEDSLGQAQKLCYAEKLFPSSTEAARAGGPLWRS